MENIAHPRLPSNLMRNPVPSRPSLLDIMQPTRKLFAVKKPPSSSRVFSRISALLETKPPLCLHIRPRVRKRVMVVCRQVLCPYVSSIFS